MEKFKKFLKVVAIIAAIAGAIAGVVIIVKKISEKNAAADDAENYISCSCCDDPAVAEEPAAE